jgi:opacity protein-like surface antigen
MPRLRLASLAVFFALVSASPARADGFLTPFWGFNFGDEQFADCPGLTSCDNHRSNWGVSIGGGRVLGFEQDFGYSKHFFGETEGGDNAVLTVMSSAYVGVPSGPVRPYFLYGLGLIRPHFKVSNSLEVTNNSFGWDLGGGVNIFFGQSVGIRGDLRKFQTFDDLTLGIFNNDNAQKLKFWRASLGLALKF